ncbi:MAG: hypothetical protein NVV63_07885 [Opitutus sp.]|nr:hypothetical protein [Opitutus sp.]
MNLDAHGAACRCLLRLRENQGEPGISDAAFIARFIGRYPEWRERPGATDTLKIVEIARELHVASRGETVAEYDRVLAEHRAGHGVLLATTHAPEQVEPVSTHRGFVMLLVEMDEDHFTAWCPYPSGLSDTLPRASRVWWERWQTSALVLYPADAVVTS